MEKMDALVGHVMEKFGFMGSIYNFLRVIDPITSEVCFDTRNKVEINTKPELFISFLYKCGAPHSITIIAI